jgi:hypothetical protein
MTSDVFRHEITEDFAQRSASALVRLTLARPRHIVVFTAVALAAVGLGLIDTPPFGSGWFGVALAIAILYPAIVFAFYRQAARSSWTFLPAGTVVRTQFGPEHYWVGMSDSEGTNRYDYHRELRQKNGVVLLVSRKGGASTFLPLELVPQPWFDHFSAQLSQER